MRLKKTTQLGILLVNLGTPEAPTAKSIRQFLREFLSDPRVIDFPKLLWWFILNLFILPFRPRRIVPLYKSIWTEQGSPLRFITQQQADLLANELAATFKQKIPVAVGMTYGTPSLRQGLLELKQAEVNKVIILPLFPQYSATTTASVYDKIAAALKKCPCLPEIRMIRDYHAHPAYIQAVSQSIQQYWQAQGKADKLVFSFHGIPLRYADKGDPYPKQCQQTARLVAEKLGLQEDEWITTYQSRLGPAQWLTPYTLETLQQLPKKGTESIQVLSPGFAADCLETLEELDKENRHAFLQAGGKQFAYIPALNANVEHIAMMKELIIANTQDW